MRYENEFVELANKKAIIKQLSKEVDALESMIKPTFMADVIEFFVSKGYKLERKSRYGETYQFVDIRQINENNTFDRTTPQLMLSGRNCLTIKFQWKLKKNHNMTQLYWYPEKQTLADFYNRRLKKVLILPIKAERNEKLKKIIEGLNED